MAFVAIAASDVDADSPITDTLMNTIRTNFDDHETRILAATQAGAVTIRVTPVYYGYPYGTWGKQADFVVWCPPGITKLKMKVRAMAHSSGDYLRLNIAASATTGPEVNIATGGSVLQDIDIEISPDATDKGGWCIVEIQRKTAGSGGSPSLHKDTETVGSLVRDYAPASYWQ